MAPLVHGGGAHAAASRICHVRCMFTFDSGLAIQRFSSLKRGQRGGDDLALCRIILAAMRLHEIEPGDQRLDPGGAILSADCNHEVHSGTGLRIVDVQNSTGRRPADGPLLWGVR
jgi:hypothetical protein